MEALRLLARIEHQREVLDEAELLLSAALELAPNYRAARVDCVRVLIERQKYLRAREEIDSLLRLEPGKSYYLSLRAAACAWLGDYETAIALYRDLLAASPGSADLHMSLGQALQAVGRRKEAAECYQTAAVIRPSFGDAWWSSWPISRPAASPRANRVDRWHPCFALGKALEDRRECAESWQFYERGNTLKRGRKPL
jgi:tetratricopeptide (TPR) repeat protein